MTPRALLARRIGHPHLYHLALGLLGGAGRPLLDGWTPVFESPPHLQVQGTIDIQFGAQGAGQVKVGREDIGKMGAQSRREPQVKKGPAQRFPGKLLLPGDHQSRHLVFEPQQDGENRGKIGGEHGEGPAAQLRARQGAVVFETVRSRGNQ